MNGEESDTLWFYRTPHGLCVVVPITRTNKGVPSRVAVDPPEGGVTAQSFIMCEQEKSVSISRFRRLKGAVNEATLRRVQELVGKFVDR
jgi:mRNA interferase MazF